MFQARPDVLRFEVGIVFEDFGFYRSLYGQTGTGRHLNHYSHPLFEDTGAKMRRIVSTEQERIKAECADETKRPDRAVLEARHAAKPDVADVADVAGGSHAAR